MSSEWTKSASYSRNRSTRGDRDRWLARIADGQLQLISSRQLAEIGFGESTVRGRIKSGRLHRTGFNQVLATSPAPLSRLQTIKAAVMSCGPNALASHWAAIEVMGLDEPAIFPVHLTRPPGNGRKRDRIVIHRSNVPACDKSGNHGILCTSAARTIVDLAALISPERLEPILIAADSERILNRRRLDELIAESAGRRGIQTLRALLGDDPVRVRSIAETRFLPICRDAGLGPPLVNSQIEVEGGSLEVDFRWPDLRLIVEVDGYRFHGGRERANADRDRDQLLAIAGWWVLRFTRDQVVGDPAECARRLARAADTCRKSRSGLRP